MKKVESFLRKCPCGKDMEVKRYKLERKKYCSKKCFYSYRIKKSGFSRVDIKPNSSWFKKGSRPWNTGKILKEKVSYKVLHEWVKNTITDPGKCEFCPSTRNLEWSNKSGEYLRIIEDWQRLCKKCHCKYDFEMFGARKEFYR